MANEVVLQLPELAALGPAYVKRGRLSACRLVGTLGSAVGRNEFRELRNGQPLSHCNSVNRLRITPAYYTTCNSLSGSVSLSQTTKPF